MDVHSVDYNLHASQVIRDRSRAAATSKMEDFLIIVKNRKPLTIIKKFTILDVAAALDLPLVTFLSMVAFVITALHIVHFTVHSNNFISISI